MPTTEYTEKAAGESAILEFFGLRVQPFGVTPDPGYLYLTASHREALASLAYGIESKRGFSVLVGEPGMGKTTLLFYLLDKLKSTARTAFLFRPDSNTKELLESLLLDLGLDADPEDVPRMHETLKAALLEDLGTGKNFVWVIDEAQDLDSSVLESVRLLSNFETPTSKLMHILLAGQPGLFDKLANPELLQLRQRVATFVQLAPLSESEVSEYIRFRVRRAGGNADAIFTKQARTLIAQASQGIPRNINSLCFACLSLGFAEAQKVVRPEIVGEVLADREPAKTLEEPTAPPPPVWPGEFLNAGRGLELEELVPQRRKTSVGFFLCVLFFLPLALLALESSSRLDVLEALRGPVAESVVARLTGYNMHMPALPDSLPPALQPPKPPVPLPESEWPSSTTQPVVTEVAIQGSPNAPTRDARRLKPMLPSRQKQEHTTRVIFAHHGDTLFELAKKYYGRSDGALIYKIKSHNPQLHDIGAILQENQPIVIPNLAPEYPWKIPSSVSHSY